MNILYAFDDLFAEVAGISILSLFENNKDADEISVYAICNSVSDTNRQRLMKLQEDYGRRIIFLDAPSVDKIAGTEIEMGKSHVLLTKATYLKLFISSLLPPDMEKILYLDCDTIISGSLSDLWEMEQGESIISAVRAAVYPFRNPQIFLKRSDIYINAGVMLINLELWRHYGVEEKFIKFIRLFGGKTPGQAEQCIINSVLKGHIGVIDPKYNYFHSIKEDKTKHRKDRARVREIERQNNPVIIHYINLKHRIDDVESGLDSPLLDVWYKWREMSPWRGLPLDHLRSPSTFTYPPPVTTKRKTIRSSLLKFTEKKCKPAYNLLNNIGIVRKAFPRRITKFTATLIKTFIKIPKYNKHRQKATGISIKDCRIGKPI
ncbi:MAG: glycosyltransferase family 8 protein [Oscillospiraceae bacterium]|nr:glycosyltransferase family 8 protein [Oscillospiraceae bacterium]